MDTRDLVHVRHIIDYLHEGLSFSEGETRDSLEQDRLLTLALCGSAVMVGAAMSRISDDFQKLNPHIPWRDAILLQDYLTNYSTFSHDSLWKDITETFPSLLVEFVRLAPRRSNNKQRLFSRNWCE